MAIAFQSPDPKDLGLAEVKGRDEEMEKRGGKRERRGENTLQL